MIDKEIIAYIGLGSNIGNREDNLLKAIEMLGQTEGIEVIKSSAFYNTAPVGYENQPDFLNGAIEIKTCLSANDLLTACMQTENVLLRERIIRWGPRTIDLDILLYGDQIYNADNLLIPHPRMHEREFVLKPLYEIAPTAVHPVFKKTVKELYSELLKSIGRRL